MELLRGVSAANNFVLALVPLLSSQLFNSRSRPGGGVSNAARMQKTDHTHRRRATRCTRAVSLPDASRAPNRKDRDHAAENFFQGGNPKTGPPISPPGPPHRQKSFLTKFPGMAPG